MAIPYKTRQFYRRVLQFLLVLLALVLVAALCWMLWLRRFVVYTADGVKLDFSLAQQFPQGQVSQPSNTLDTPDIYFTQTEETTAPVIDPAVQFKAYYVTLDELQNDRENVLRQIRELPAGTPVMMDVKGYRGYFYYSSDLGSTSSSFDAAEMDEFFAAVHESGAYTIARLPAFRDYLFALDHVQCGLKVKQGYLWVDDQYCYWLDPANEETLTYLIQICKELRSLGFDEVAFQDFSFPDTNEIVYDGDREQALLDAAETLARTCASADFAISFISTDPTFPLPEGNCRLYLQDVAAVDVQTVLMLMDADVMERTVFFTTTNDTRYQVCGTIQPLIMAD